jgi:hypothetical protein
MSMNHCTSLGPQMGAHKSSNIYTFPLGSICTVMVYPLWHNGQKNGCCSPAGGNYQMRKWLPNLVQTPKLALILLEIEDCTIEPVRKAHTKIDYSISIKVRQWVWDSNLEIPCDVDDRYQLPVLLLSVIPTALHSKFMGPIKQAIYIPSH